MEGMCNRRKTGRDNKMPHALKKASRGNSVACSIIAKISLEITSILHFIMYHPSQALKVGWDARDGYVFTCKAEKEKQNKTKAK